MAQKGGELHHSLESGLADVRLSEMINGAELQLVGYSSLVDHLPCVVSAIVIGHMFAFGHGTSQREVTTFRVLILHRYSYNTPSYAVSSFRPSARIIQTIILITHPVLVNLQ